MPQNEVMCSRGEAPVCEDIMHPHPIQEGRAMPEAPVIVSLPIADLQTSCSFYRHALGLKTLGEARLERVAMGVLARLSTRCRRDRRHG